MEFYHDPYADAGSGWHMVVPGFTDAERAAMENRKRIEAEARAAWNAVHTFRFRFGGSHEAEVVAGNGQIEIEIDGKRELINPIGNYLYARLRPDGSMRVKFDLSCLPEGYIPSPLTRDLVAHFRLQIEAWFSWDEQEQVFLPDEKSFPNWEKLWTKTLAFVQARSRILVGGELYQFPIHSITGYAPDGRGVAEVNGQSFPVRYVSEGDAGGHWELIAK